jgi:superfamily I DNA and/or RNA helicase
MTAKDNFCDIQVALIENEQQAEINQVLQEYKLLSEKELIKKGLLLKVSLSGLKSGIAGTTLLQFEHSRQGTNAFRVGDVVEIKGKEECAIASGVVTKNTDTQLVISMKQDPPTDLPDVVKILKMVNSISYQRMKDAMKQLKECNNHLFRVLLNQVKPTISEQEHIEFLDDTLNESQKKAVQLCIAVNEFGMIHGPPGTGKSHTCVELIRQLVSKKKRILVCGPSNISVDNLIERLAKYKLDLVRIGHPARILDSVLHYGLDQRMDYSDQGQIVKDVRDEIDETLAKIQKTKRKSERYEMYKTVSFLRKELRERERNVMQTVVGNAQVILTTLNGCGSRVLKNEEFDVLLIDEASQALEAECWIAILKAKKLILAGDHCQLPPTIKSIMQFSSDQFYGSKLICAPNIENQTLIDLKVEENEDTSASVLFIDTAYASFNESSDEQDSKFNQGEANCVVRYLKTLLQLGVNPLDMAIISPYNGQVRLIKELLSGTIPELEIGTVDGFQGREKQVVIVSLVRSNDKGDVGFLSEERRLNVAMTRPKRHLCMIGDSNTLRQNLFLKKVVDYLEDIAEIRYPEMI